MNNELYREIILDHYQHPRNSGKPVTYTHTTKKDNPFCGDQIEVFLTVVNGFVTDMHFIANGCAISIASASMLTEKLRGLRVKRVNELKTEDILKMLDIQLTPTRLKCALLPLEAIQGALSH